jgi:hypothetical protein
VSHRVRTNNDFGNEK